MTLVFWEVGKRINKEILQYVRADYGKNIVTTVSSQLKKRYGILYRKRDIKDNRNKNKYCDGRSARTYSTEKIAINQE